MMSEKETEYLYDCCVVRFFSCMRVRRRRPRNHPRGEVSVDLDSLVPQLIKTMLLLIDYKAIVANHSGHHEIFWPS